MDASSGKPDFLQVMQPTSKTELQAIVFAVYRVRLIGQ